MMPGPIDTVYPNGPVDKSAVRGDDRTAKRRSMANADAVRNVDLSGQFAGVYIQSTHFSYDLDTSDTTTLDDMTDTSPCIRDNQGNGFFKVAGGGGGDVAGDTHAASSKTAPDDADELPLVDSAASNVLKKLTWANLKATLSSTFISSGQIREKLTGNRTYYVAPSGSDSNDGLTALTPFLTKQKAWNTILTLDLNGFVATMQVADGTYTAGISSAFAPIGGTVVVQGNAGLPANVLISTTSGHCFNFTGLPKNVTIKDLKVQTTTSGVGIRAADKGVTISFSNINFGACASQHVNVSSGASISATGAYAISGGAPNHIRADGAGSAFAASTITVTLTGTPSFSHAFVWGFSASMQNWFNITFSGAATGARYQVESNAVINSFGSGTSYFPGNTAGVGTNSGASPYGLYQ